jgi:hypothetical protein
VALHLVKLCVGAQSIQDLRDWQKRRGVLCEAGYPIVVHYTRNRPKRWAELVDGGSLYWVIKGSILVRNPIVAVETVEREEDGKRCALVLKAEPVETLPKRHRPIQGWRYFASENAPPDRSAGVESGDFKVPPALAAELRSLGLI